MPQFNPDQDIPSLSGKVILVTGGSRGLGRETIKQLSKHEPAQIFLAARSRERADAAISQIQQAVPDAAPITFLELDLASLESIKRAVDNFKSLSSQLHLLFNNGGIMCFPPGLTEDGYEIQFGTNYMGHALLTKLLLPTLQATAKSGADVRIINLSSMVESVTKQWSNFEALKTDMASEMTHMRYAISKSASIHHARALSRLYPEIRSISLHPGIVGTEITQGVDITFPYLKPITWLFKLFTASVEKGVLNQLWASVSPDAKSGEFYHPIGVTGKGSLQTQDRDFEEKLWKWTEEELEKYSQSDQ